MIFFLTFGCFNTEFTPFTIWRMHRKPSYSCLKTDKGNPGLKMWHQASALGLIPGLSHSPVIPYQSDLLSHAPTEGSSSAGIRRAEGKRLIPTATFYKWATTEFLSMGDNFPQNLDVCQKHYFANNTKLCSGELNGNCCYLDQRIVLLL